VPGDRFGSQDLEVDSEAIARFHDKARDHGNAGAVEEIHSLRSSTIGIAGLVRASLSISRMGA